ncbi:ATP-binding cassette domain-containing protein [uncultured Subdoligranulum sp.]|uniref:ATP-binding cassette domain-containing protein n=1 Tax=uncultured Subdoligranulum sp. TaxID=512298 RepID=UPI0025E1C47D|nr:ATP-binding cassette domain-containing protein [uncultured Subdoligranulum sp.]
MEIITVKDLTKTFTYSVKEKGLRGSLHNLFARPTLQKTAVNGVSFSIEKGEAVGLLGPNGAGKTTTLKMLSGILYPTAGTATVAGFVPWERRRDYQRRFAIVMGQKTQLWPNLPALDTFELNRRIYDLDPREYQRTLDELTDLLGVGSLLQVQVLPFGYTTQFCVNIVNGRLAPGQIGRGFAVQWAWVAGFTLLYRLLWRRGARRYTAVGG